jgi:hypothetical protein
MNKEFLMIASMAVGGLGFSIGGTGPKWVRRYVMPLLLGVICFFAGLVWWRCLGMALSLSPVLHLGYGEKISYWRKALIFASYSLTTLWLGLSVWQILLPCLALLLFLLSNQKWSSSTFVWKICEFIIGSLIGITIASLISR